MRAFLPQPSLSRATKLPRLFASLFQDFAEELLKNLVIILEYPDGFRLIELLEGL